MICGFCNFSSAFVAALLIAKYGRKSIMLVGNIIITACLIGYGLVCIFINEQEIIMKYLLFIYSFSFGFSLGPLLWIYVAEILPDKGLGIAVLVNWLFTFAIAQVFPNMLIQFGDGNTLLLFGILSFLGNLFIVFAVKETKGKSDREIAELFGWVSRRDSELSNNFEGTISKVL
jgi:SP family arabinose:H+ symporter-like MFS transporter